MADLAVAVTADAVAVPEELVLPKMEEMLNKEIVVVELAMDSLDLDPNLLTTPQEEVVQEMEDQPPRRTVAVVVMGWPPT